MPAASTARLNAPAIAIAGAPRTFMLSIAFQPEVMTCSWISNEHLDLDVYPTICGVQYTIVNLFEGLRSQTTRVLIRLRLSFLCEKLTSCFWSRSNRSPRLYLILSSIRSATTNLCFFQEEGKVKTKRRMQLPQLIDVLFETTSRLKHQLETNRKTTASLLERANQLKVRLDKTILG